MSSSSEDEYYPITDGDVLQNKTQKGGKKNPSSAAATSKSKTTVLKEPSGTRRENSSGKTIVEAAAIDNNTRQEFFRYKMRYVLLSMFAMLSMTNSFHWIQYAILGTIVESYYRISIDWVNATSTIYMVSYIIGIIPATLITERYGIRKSILIAATLNALGSWIKSISTNRDGFPVAMIAQTIIATAQLFILNVPPLLAATWFPNEEVPQATAYGVMGNQLGIAFGFVIPPLLMPTVTDDQEKHKPLILNESQIQHVQQGFKNLHLYTSIISTVLLILIVMFFKEKPANPPSLQQAMIRDLEKEKRNQKSSCTDSMRKLFSNRNFVMLFFSYGMLVGIFFALSTVLSQMITNTMGNQYIQEAGYMGLVITLSGIIGSIVCGYILGWTGKFKMVTVLLALFSMFGCLMFGIAVHICSLAFLFTASGILGFFMTGFLPIGFEFASEITYPEPESTSAGYLSASAQIFGLIITMASSPFLEKFGADLTNGLYVALLAMATVLTMMVSNDLRRQNCNTKAIKSPP